MDRFQILAEERDKRWIRRMLTSGGFGEKCSMCMNWGDSEESLHVWERKLPWFLAWIEVNQLDAVDDAVAGLREWSTLTDTAIVTTVPGKLDILDDICKRVPELQIRPGLKTNDALKRFDDVDGWKNVGVMLSYMAERCGSDTVVVENESAVRKYGAGEETLDMNLFRKAMQHLPKALKIIWYPGITGNDADKQTRMMDLCNAVVEVHGNVTLVDRSYGRPTAVGWHWSKEARKWLVVIGAPTIPMQYVQGSDDYWRYDQIREALGHVINAPEVIIYPGAKDFEPAAIGIGKALEVGG